MKELLREGGALLMNAAENMEILTRRSDPTLRLVSQIKETEQRLKFYQDQTTSVMRDVRTSFSAKLHSWKTTELVSKEPRTTLLTSRNHPTSTNVALTIRWDEIHQDVQRTKGLLELHNFQKLSFEDNLLRGRFDAMESRLCSTHYCQLHSCPRGAHST
ncbi:hypothetical protein V3C99_011550 [Haemonchus contortus]